MRPALHLRLPALPSISLGSASETRYLLGLVGRLELVAGDGPANLAGRYHELTRGLQALIDSLDSEGR